MIEMIKKSAGVVDGPEETSCNLCNFRLEVRIDGSNGAMALIRWQLSVDLQTEDPSLGVRFQGQGTSRKSREIQTGIVPECWINTSTSPLDSHCTSPL